MPKTKTKANQSDALGWWKPDGPAPVSGAAELGEALRKIRGPIYLLDEGGKDAYGSGGHASFGSPEEMPEGSFALRGFASAVPLESLGSASFRAAMGTRYAYVGGAMASGIGSVEYVSALGRAGMLGFFGAGGLPLAAVEEAIGRIQKELGDLPYGFNFLHSPNESGLEEAVCDLYLSRGVRLVEAAAFMDLTLPLVRFRVSGISRDPSGRVNAPNRIIAKVSREEVATKFFSPPPEKFLRVLVERGVIDEEQAKMAAEIPMAQALTAESDSGGHTDNQSPLTATPIMIALRDKFQERFGYADKLHVGAAGGVSTPSSAAAAFAMGVDYILTGTVNQACVESGTSDRVRAMLAEAGQADIAMAPAADMFEMGVKVQVLKRGTMFAMRAQQLYDLYKAHKSIEEIPADDRVKLEKRLFHANLDEIWAQTKAFFEKRDPVQVERAAKDPRHKMALIFRWYLGNSSRWAKTGDPARQVDYQIWCGPAMGAFNEWAKGSFLEKPEGRRVAAVGMNLLFGAAIQRRVNELRGQGAEIPVSASRIRPLEIERIQEYAR